MLESVSYQGSINKSLFLKSRAEPIARKKDLFSPCATAKQAIIKVSTWIKITLKARRTRRSIFLAIFFGGVAPSLRSPCFLFVKKFLNERWGFEVRAAIREQFLYRSRLKSGRRFGVALGPHASACGFTGYVYLRTWMNHLSPTGIWSDIKVLARIRNLFSFRITSPEAFASAPSSPLTHGARLCPTSEQDVEAKRRVNFLSARIQKPSSHMFGASRTDTLSNPS